MSQPYTSVRAHTQKRTHTQVRMKDSSHTRRMCCARSTGFQEYCSRRGGEGRKGADKALTLMGRGPDKEGSTHKVEALPAQECENVEEAHTREPEGPGRELVTRQHRRRKHKLEEQEVDRALLGGLWGHRGNAHHMRTRVEV